jgi:WD40 repeat protein
VKQYASILSFLLIAMFPFAAVAQEEDSSSRGIAVAPKTPPMAIPAPAAYVTGTPKLVAQLGHSEAITAGALSPDGRYALTGASGDDSAAILWDLASGSELKRFVTGFSDFSDLAFVPDGKRVLVASSQSVFLFDVQTGTEIYRFDLDDDSHHVFDIDVSPNGRQLLVAYSWADAPSYDWQSAGVLFDLDNGQLVRRFSEKGDAQIWSVAFSPNGRRALIGGEKGRATLWDVETGQQLRTFVTKERFVSPVLSLAFTPDGKRVLTGMASWIPNKGEGKCEKSNGGHCTTLWDVDTGEAIQRIRLSSTGKGDVSISADGTLVRGSSPLTLIEVGTGETITPNEHISDVFDFSKDGTRLLAHMHSYEQPALYQDVNRVIPILWDIEANKELQRLQSRGATAINSVNWSLDGRMVLTSDANKAYLWDLAMGNLVQQFAEPMEHLSEARPYGNYYDYFSTPVERAILSPDGRRVLTVGSEGRAILWDAETGAEVRRFVGHKGPVFAAAISPDGRLVATGGDDKTARIWDLESGRQLASLRARWAVVDLNFSADGTLLAAGTFENNNNSNGQVLVWDVAKRKKLKGFSGKSLDRPTMTVVFSPDGQEVISGGWDYMRGWDINTGEETGSHLVTGVSDMAFSPDGARALTNSEEQFAAALHDNETGEVVSTLAHDGPVNSVAFSPDGEWMLTGSADRTTRIWNAETGDEHARLVAFHDGTFAVTDPEGRFDAPNGGDIDGLHWVAGLEPIALSQLKSRYYEPGLLAKLLGLSDEPLRDVESLMAGTVDLFPEVVVTQAPSATDRSLKLRLNNRGGGIGRVAVFVNGKEVAEDARVPGADPQAGQLDLVLDLSGSQYFIAGQDNQIEVVAYNADNYLASPRIRVTAAASGAPVVVDKPQLWSIVAGTSDYLGAGLDLRFAAKDAEDFATALGVAAGKLLGPERVHITRLYDGEAPATRATMAAAFETFRQAAPGDILVLYLAGHGVSLGGQDGDYYYLLQDAESGDIRDPDLRAQSALSSEQLTEWIKQVPALKQVLILDTCHAGQLISDMTLTRSLPSSSEQRSLDRMKDRTGMFIIAGSAADSVSYEASRYGQGVLTYSLLEGMRGAALREDAFVDVGQLLTYAVDRVPTLARGIGGIQQPRMATPSGGESFDLGWLPAAADLAKIPIAQERPLVLKTSFTPEDQPLDVLELTPMVNEALRVRAADPRNAPFVFVEADQSAGAWRIAGRYSVEGTTVMLKVYLYQDKTVADQFELQGQTHALDVLSAEIVRQIGARVKVQPLQSAVVNKAVQ